MDLWKFAAFVGLAVLLMGFRVGLRALQRRAQNPDAERVLPPRWFLIALAAGILGVGVWVAFQD